MAERALGIALGLRGLLQTVDESPDGELLSRFLERRDEEAFAALVRRHGPMVFAVCRRMLRNEHDAEDAFQATFLVLARRASVVRPRSLLGNWLYGVAYRTAVVARRAAAVRRSKESRAAEMRDPAPAPDEFSPELREVLDRELAALPDIYRAAVICCDLEGLSRRDAALRLGWSEGTLSSRLSRARSLLARRLSKHGLAVAGVGLPGLASAGVPQGLVESTSRIGFLVAAGEAAVVAAPVAALSQGVMKAMLLSKLKVMTAGLMVGCAVLATTTAGWRAEASPQDRPATKSKGEPPDAPRAKAKDPDKERIAQLEKERDALLARLVEMEEQLKRLKEMRYAESVRGAYDELLAKEKDLLLRGTTPPPAPTPGATPPSAAPAPGAPPPPSSTRPTPPSANTPAPAATRPAEPARPTPPPATPPGASPPPSPAQPAPATPAANVPSGFTPAGPPAAKLVRGVYPVEDLVTDDKSAEALVRVIRATVEPRSWTMAGGEGGVEYFPDAKSLVVRNTGEAHKQVEEVLDMLRVAKERAKSRQGPGERK